MEKLYVMDNRGMEKEAYKVRYINFENNNYFIYTLNEIDSEGYVKLYLKKINNGEDTGLTALEWEGIKASIPLIVKEIKNNNISSFKDLSMKNIKEIMDGNSKVFKLKKNIVELITYEEPVTDDIPKFEMNESDDSLVEFKEESPKFDEKDEISVINQNQEKIKQLELELVKYKEFCVNLKKQNEIFSPGVARKKPSGTGTRGNCFPSATVPVPSGDLGDYNKEGQSWVFLQIR